MNDQMGAQPVIILPEKTSRLLGKTAQKMNIAVAKAVAEAVRSTLGPKGMDKMLVDELGDVTITNDGATILKEMHIEHPVGKMMVEVAKTQDEETGDGTTSAVVMAGELLRRAEDLLDQNIHPSTLINGYKLASEKAQEELPKIAEPVDIKDTKNLLEVAKTTMASKGTTGTSKEKLAQIVVDAIQRVAEKVDGGWVINEDYIKIEKKQGGSLDDSELINGIVIDKERVHSGMPKKVENAKIALLDCALEIEKTETDARINISSPEQLQQFLDQEEKILEGMVERIAKTGANVVFCQKGIDDLAQHYLAKKGIYAVRRVKKSDLDKLARATGGNIVTNIKDLESKDLGKAGIVEELKIAGETMTFVRECENPKAVTILIRGGTEHVVAEAERAVEDAIGAVSSAVEMGKIVVGGGAVEVELAMKLREYAKEVGGREQLAIEAFADSLEIIPRTLAESAGMDPIDTLVKLRAQHAKGNKYMGIHVFHAKIENMKENNVLEPMKVKKQAIASAAEAAEMILKIDDVIAASREKTPPVGPKGEGMGGGEMMD